MFFFSSAISVFSLFKVKEWRQMTYMGWSTFDRVPPFFFPSVLCEFGTAFSVFCWHERLVEETIIGRDEEEFSRTPSSWWTDKKGKQSSKMPGIDFAGLFYVAIQDNRHRQCFQPGNRLLDHSLQVLERLLCPWVTGW